MFRYPSFIIVGVLSFLCFFANSAVTNAQGYGLSEAGKDTGYNTSEDVFSVTTRVVSVTLYVLGLVFLTMTFYAGLRWMTAQGNEEYVKKSKQILIAAVIGFGVISVSYAISRFVFQRLTQAPNQNKTPVATST